MVQLTQRRRICLLSLGALLLTVAPSAHAAGRPSSARPVGFRHDGTGHWRGVTPPLRWDDSGTNTCWKVKLDHWGNGEPIVVNDRLYLVQDLDWWNFERVAPSLLCLDPKDGSVIWERELDHTVALPASEAARAKADWIALRKKYHEGWQICAEVAGKHKPGRGADKAARKALEGTGLHLGKPLTVFNLSIRDRSFRGREKKLRSSHFWICQWSQPRGQWCGAGYATPVSDGEHIWVRTGYSAVFCFDMEGNRIWTSLHEGGQGKKQSWCVSPVLVDGVLVVADSQNCHGFDAIGLDAASGKQLWSVKPWPSWEGYSLGSCQVLDVDGRKVVHLPSGRVIRPADGMILAEGLGRQKWTASTADGNVLVAPFMGVKKLRGKANDLYPWVPEEDSLAAWRLSWDGPDRIGAERLWHVPVGRRKLEISPVLAHGLVFQVEEDGGIMAIDAQTGKVVGRKKWRAIGARLRHSWNLAVAGPYLYAIGYKSGKVVVLKADRTLAKVALNPPIGRPPEECPRPYATWRIGAGRKPDPRLPQTGALTFHKDRLYLRAWRYLYCLQR